MADFLYEELDVVSKMGFLDDFKSIPNVIVENLNPKFQIRPYQAEAFGRYFYQSKKADSKHLLFNMATGSGKTLLMAGLILHLYSLGYRNFLFFVNSTNIISKTKDNFTSSNSSKYLFNDKIQFEGRTISINDVESFDEADSRNINIKFTTIQKLGSDLTTQKENCITLEDLKNHKIVLLGDEAHHNSTKTKKKSDEADALIEDTTASWENTVEKVFGSNPDNILLEFTATLDFLDRNVMDKYKSKILYKYDLKAFRTDGYSKDVNILQSDCDKSYRMLQAVILSQYRQDIATKHKINLKPVILFKAHKSIAESLENQVEFSRLISNLNITQIKKLKEVTNIEVIQKALDFYTDYNILVSKIKANFGVERVLTTNETKGDQDKYKNETNIQKLLNTLEYKDNQIRAIFTVNKLNEGWDVLNLFDIVRLYTSRDGDMDKNGEYKAGKTTISEAQLIGRGARYNPFNCDELDKFKRKFDSNLNHELRILEELYYHSYNEPRYISEIRSTLIKQGLLDEKVTTKTLKLKESFKKTNFYKLGYILSNSKVQKEGDYVDFENLSVKNKNIEYTVNSGKGKSTKVFDEKDSGDLNIKRIIKPVNLKDLGISRIKKALQKDNFYSFSNLKEKYLVTLKSINNFTKLSEYLGNIEINLNGPKVLVDKLPVKEAIKAIEKVLEAIKTECKSKVQEFEGTKEFKPKRINEVFFDQILKMIESTDGDKNYLADKEWYAFESNFGTSEELAMVRAIETLIKTFEQKYEDIYLLRNERHFRLYRFSNGEGFEPDFVLFMKQKVGHPVVYQIFLEPKGNQFRGEDGTFETGKEAHKIAFLNELKKEFKDKIIKLSVIKSYKIIGVPMFYNEKDENKFKEELQEALF